jgi:rubrerythrin
MATIEHRLGRATMNDVLEALRGEAYAYARYRLYAAAVRSRGNERLAELFEQTAQVELDEHFAELAALAGLGERDEDCLRDALLGEAEEADTIYPEYAERAARNGDGAAAERFAELAADEAEHHAAFAAALRDRLSSRP